MMPPYDSWLVAAAFLCALLAIADNGRRKAQLASAAIALYITGAAASLVLKVILS